MLPQWRAVDVSNLTSPKFEYHPYRSGEKRVNPRAWYGMKWKMEWNENFGMEYESCQNGMGDNLPYFHTKSILDFANGICRKIYTNIVITKNL